MKYAFILPLSALLALVLIGLLVEYNVIPPGLALLEMLKSNLQDGIYFVIFVIILLESIIYMGFYFPGQFFAVVIVVGANPNVKDVLFLTLAMVCAATIGSLVNYCMGRYLKRDEPDDESPTKISRLLLAMIHINSLAFFMFAQGANRKSIKIVAFAGLLNLPYYLLLIAGTAVLSDQVMMMAENTYLLVSVICIWLVVALIYDAKKHSWGKVKPI